MAILVLSRIRSPKSQEIGKPIQQESQAGASNRFSKTNKPNCKFTRNLQVCTLFVFIILGLWSLIEKGKVKKKSRIRETMNLSTDADHRTDIFFWGGACDL